MLWYIRSILARPFILHQGGMKPIFTLLLRAGRLSPLHVKLRVVSTTPCIMSMQNDLQMP
jgi:hypothetical protein